MDQDDLLKEALDAFDAGDLEKLGQLLTDHPRLAALRASRPAKGYFAHPYLLWFIADNPIRRGTLPPNVVELTSLLIKHIRQNSPETFADQRDYALGLVTTGRIPKECGVQIPLIDLLIANGGTPGNGIGALAHGNPETARYLIEKSGNWTLPTAAGLGEMEKVADLFVTAGEPARKLALVIAAFYGRQEIIAYLLAQGVDPNGYPDQNSGFHAHATALHQAVWSGNPEAVKLLLDAGADPNATDRIYEGTPLGWALHGLGESTDPNQKEGLTRIAKVLRPVSPDPEGEGRAG